MPNWPHAPAHRLTEAGVYMVTAGTYQKHQFFSSPERLTLLRDLLLDLAHEFGWRLEAWAVMANHYHFLGHSPDDPRTLSHLISKLHSTTATTLNEFDSQPGRRIWYEFWDSHITYQRSYLARLKYIHQNPVHHGLVQVATAYPWCSAAWCEREATRAFVRMLEEMKIDQLKIYDEF